MPLAAKIVFTVILAISIVSILFKNQFTADKGAYDKNNWNNYDYANWIVATLLSWAWRITLMVFLWAF